MSLRRYWESKPLSCILIAAAFFRLLAVVFSKGYAMHDDHFLVIEPAQSWVDGSDYNYWLPTLSGGATQASGHSLLYPGVHYLLFSLLQFLGINDPQSKMYVVRFLHAALSMTIVVLGYKIAERKGGISAAKAAGILLALLFFMPMLSVRNLVEFVCIPPLMYATWIVIKNEQSKKVLPFFIAGLFLGLAFNIRFQTALFIGGFGLVFLIQKKWKQAIILGLGILISVSIVQGLTDMIIWHHPFTEFKEYVRYNAEHANDYITGKWYNYILLIAGLLIPPISIFIIFGFVKGWRKHLILFLPAFIFFAFHSFFPNKQERFILPAVPFIITLGSIGWCQFMEQSAFWNRNQKLYRACWIFFWSVNTIPLFFVSTAYSHRSRVESMVYLSQKKDFKNLIVEESNQWDFKMPPLFYSQHWVSYFHVTQEVSADSLKRLLPTIHFDDYCPYPNYVVFSQEDNIDERVKNFKKYFPDIQYETTIEPGFVDKVMFRLNKHNANYTTYIYKMSR